MMEDPTKYRIPNEIVFDGNCVVPEPYFSLEVNERVKSFPLDENDVLVATYPKSGTTWMQEIVYLILNDANVQKAKETPLVQRAKFLEFIEPDHPSYLDQLLRDPVKPRPIKTHLPVTYFSKQLSEGKAKIVVVMRNPKDTALSMYMFYKNNDIFGPFPGTWNEFFELFKIKHMHYGDVYDWNLGWFSRRHDPNVIFIKFEDMKKDIRAVIRQVARHCNKTLTDEQVEIIAQHTSLGSMMTNPMVNLSLRTGVTRKVKSFIREGKVGDWKKHFSDEQNQYFETRYVEEYKPRGLEFEFE